jgi:hypothetical protein
MSPGMSLLYKTSLDIKKHHLSGMLMIKKIAVLVKDIEPGHMQPETLTGDSELFRIVFFNEIGMKYFDLELKRDSFTVISCFTSLNKKALLKIFETDFRMLLDQQTAENDGFYRQEETNMLVLKSRAGKYQTWKIYAPAGDTLLKTSAKSTIADPVFIYYPQYSGGLPSKISIENPVIGMKFFMKIMSQ